MKRLLKGLAALFALGLAYTAVPAATIITWLPFKDLVVGAGLPPNGNMLNVKNFGATGNGVTDDTAACNAAVAALPAYSTTHNQVLQIIYWPAGTYLMSGTCTRLPNQPQAANVVMIGENLATTHIKLADNTTGFTSAGTPKSIFQLNSGNVFNQSPSPSTGEGNEGFNNTVENLTFDLGSGNAGAVAIDTVVNNIGTYRNVAINTTGAAYAGMLMNRRYNGPSLASNVTITGPFQYGIRIGWSELQPVFEHVTINGATVVGIRNTQNSVTMRDVTITMNGGCGYTQIDSGDGQYTTPWGANEGLTTWVTGTINGTGTAATCITNGAYNFSGVNSIGFNGGGTVSLDGVYQNSGSGMVKIGNPSWSLTVKNTPTFSTAGSTQWTQVVTSTAPHDATADIQAALNNQAARVVYLPTGSYAISGQMIVPDYIDRIECLYSIFQITGGGGYYPFVVNATRTKDLYIRRCIVENGGGGITAFINWQPPAPARLIVTDYSGPQFVIQQASAGEIYGENVNATHISTIGSTSGVWLRQFDPEITSTKIFNTNTNLWILGLKTEQASTAAANDGGNIEIVGGIHYPGVAVGVPMFTNVNNGRISASYVEEELASGLGWTQEMTSTINSVSNTILTNTFFQRGPFNGRTIALLSTDLFVPTILSSRGINPSILASSGVGTAVTTASLSADYAYTGTPSWSLSVNPGGKYAINSGTGAITVNAALTAGTDNITVAVSGLTLGASSGATVAALPIAITVRTAFSAFDPANTAAHITLSNGNLTATANASDGNGSITRGLGNHTTGKYYCEFTIGSVGTPLHGIQIGVLNGSKVVTNGNSLGYDSNQSISYASINGRVEYNNGGLFTGATFTTGDIIGMLTDVDALTVTFYKNNVSQGTYSIAATTGALYPGAESDDNTAAVTANYGPASTYTYNHPAGDW